MKIAIHQPNFLPWIGYFHKIVQVDKFIFFDDVQLPRGKSFCSRTKILINGKESWLTIPILRKLDISSIKEVKVNNNTNWKGKHLKTLELNYQKARFLSDIFPIIEEIYSSHSDYLVDYNIPLIIGFSTYLGLNIEFVESSIILPGSVKKGVDRIIEIIKYVGAEAYLSGTGAGSRKYIDDEVFKRKHINLIWQEFEHPVYPQLSRNFVPNLSIVDLLLNCGKKSKELFF